MNIIKIKTTLFLFFCFLTQINAQIEIAKPDFLKIQTEVKNKSSKYYLPKLLDTFKTSGYNMPAEEMHYLYFGYSMVNEYTPLSLADKKKKVTLLSNKKANCNDIVSSCNQLLEDDPFDLDYRKILNTCNYELHHNDKESDQSFKLFYNIFMSIRKTGLGTSADNPIYIINENHVDAVLTLLGYIQTGEHVKNGNSLFVSVKENYFRLKGVYFDITLINQKNFEKVAVQVQPNVIEPIIESKKESKIEISENKIENNVFVAEKEVIENKEKTENKEEYFDVKAKPEYTELKNNKSAISTTNNFIAFNSTQNKNNYSENEPKIVENESVECRESKLEERNRKIQEVREQKTKELEERRLAKEMLMKEREEMRNRMIEERKQAIEERKKAIEESRNQ